MITLFGLVVLGLPDNNVLLVPAPIALLALSPPSPGVVVVRRNLGARGDSDGSGVEAELSALALRADDLGVMLPVDIASLLGVSSCLRLGVACCASFRTVGVRLMLLDCTDGLALPAMRGVIGDFTLRLAARVGFKGRPLALLPPLSDMFLLCYQDIPPPLW